MIHDASSGVGDAAEHHWLRGLSLVTALLPLVAAAMGFYRSANLEVSIDEFATAMFSSRTFGDLWASLAHVDAIVGPYYGVIHLLAPPLSYGPWIRWPSVIASAGTVALVGFLARRWWGPVSAVIAATFVTINPLVIYMSSMARPYAMAMLFVTLALLCVEIASSRTGKGFWVLYAFSASAAVLMHPFSLLAVATTSILALGRSRRAFVSWAVATIASLVSLLPILAVAYRQRDQVSWIAHLSPREALATLASIVAMQVDGTNNLVDYVALAIIGLFAVAAPLALAVRAWRRGDHDSARKVGTALVLFVGPWLALYSISLVATPILNFKYLTWSAIGAPLLMGYSFESLLKKGIILKSAALTVIVCLLAYYAVPAYGLLTQRTLIPDFGSAAARIRQSSHPGDLLVVAQPYDSGGLAYGIAYDLGDEQYAAEVLGRLPSGRQPILEVRVILSVEPFRSTPLQTPLTQPAVAWFFPFAEVPRSFATGTSNTELACTATEGSVSQLSPDDSLLLRGLCVP